jgi:hypothetical protein
MKFKEHYLKESPEQITDATELALKIEATIKEIFPNSHVNAKFSSNIMNSITIWFTLGKDKSEYANGIAQNDPLWQILHVENMSKEGVLEPKLKIISTIAGRLSLKNYTRVKTGWRNYQGSPEQIIEHIRKYFTNVKQVLIANKDNIDVIVKDKV